MTIKQTIECDYGPCRKTLGRERLTDTVPFYLTVQPSNSEVLHFCGWEHLEKYAADSDERAQEASEKP